MVISPNKKMYEMGADLSALFQKHKPTCTDAVELALDIILAAVIKLRTTQQTSPNKKVYEMEADLSALFQKHKPTCLDAVELATGIILSAVIKLRTTQLVDEEIKAWKN